MKFKAIAQFRIERTLGVFEADTEEEAQTIALDSDAYFVARRRLNAAAYEVRISPAQPADLFGITVGARRLCKTN